MLGKGYCAVSKGVKCADDSTGLVTLVETSGDTPRLEGIDTKGVRHGGSGPTGSQIRCRCDGMAF